MKKDSGKWLLKATLPVIAIMAAIALFVTVLAAAPKAADDKGGRRVQWIDEKGVSHTTVLSPRVKPAGTQQIPPARVQQTTPLPQIITAKVEKVLSGDTIVIAGNRKVRYIGVRAPSQKDPGYKEALQYHKKLIEGKYVNILFDQSPKTEDGTMLGFVFLGQLTFVNADLIRFGHAYASPQPPNTKYESLFGNLEKRAQSRNLGVWKK